MKLRNIKDDGIRKILIIGFNSVGENLLITPAIKKIKDTYRNSQIDIIVGDKAVEFVLDNPWFSSYFLWEKMGYYKLIKKLRSQKYDLIIDFKTPFFLFFLKSKYKLTFFMKDILSDKFYIHQSEKIMKFLEPLFGPGEVKIFFPVSNYYREKVKEIFSSFKIKSSDLVVVLIPGGEAVFKRWDKEKYVILGKELIKRYGVKIIIIGLKGEEKLTKEIKDLIGSDNVFDLGGKTDLKENFVIFELSDLIVTNDSYLMYLACASGTDIVTIFGPGNPYKYGPVGEKSYVVHSNIDCFPCSSYKKCKMEYQCIKEVKVEDVFKYCSIILDEKSYPKLFEI